MAQIFDRDIPNAFESKDVEGKLYEMWEKSGYLKPENVEKYLLEKGYTVNKPFVMTLPPPNANGDLHIGHTTGYSFMDAMGRFNRMTGHPTLLIAGKDHAGIQTEAVYTKILKAEGVDKYELGREEFYKRCYEFCTQQAVNARAQEKRIGLSADWDREFFTLDPKLTETVYQTFLNLYEDGLVYRGKRIINQCPYCGTALADIDTYHKEMRGIFAYIVYPFVDEADRKFAKEKLGQEGVTVATTRPETMLGDTAVAVNPEDPRYAEFIGKKVLLPFVNREIPIIADEAVSIENGAGALKVTPAHSPIDFAIGEKHGLEVINVIDEKGLMTGPIPDEFIGMDTVSCSKALVAELDKKGLLLKIEGIKHEVAVCERCDTPIQPIVSFQWFVDTKPLAKMALDMLNSGETVVMPEGQMTALKHFFEEIQPWCISRQLWWSHPIPIWYSGSRHLHDWLIDNPGKSLADYESATGKKANGTGKAFASVEMPEADENWDGDKVELKFEKESDVFDTWFSSGQWPFSTLMASTDEDGNSLFPKYYPTDVMVHARDILYWWSGRMMMMSAYMTNRFAKQNKHGFTKPVAPFHTVFLTGMIAAADGSKMSKSRNNTVSPSEIMDKYGVDSLRLWYYSDALPGANTPLREEKIKGNRFLVNKIWNASRFVMLNISDDEIPDIKKAMDGMGGERVDTTNAHVEAVKSYLVDHKYHLAVEAVREFFWHEFADKWIEEVKTQIKDENVGSEIRVKALAELVYVLKLNLKVMHPMIPYVTEAVWQELVKIGLAEELLIIQQI